MHAYILCAGDGSRMSPYGATRPKCLLPVVNRTVLDHLLDALQPLKPESVTVATSERWGGDVRGVVGSRAAVVPVGPTSGSAETLRRIWKRGTHALVIPGDVLVKTDDLARLAASETAGPTLLVSPLPEEESGEWIGVRVVGDQVDAIVGHPREAPGHRVVSFSLPPDVFDWLDRTPLRFPNVEVGMMPAEERYLEATLELWRASGRTLRAIEAEYPTQDLDKPWHLLAANVDAVAGLATELTENRLGEGATIDPTALVEGHVALGARSRIGRNVIVRGNVIAGDDVVIESGAIINGDIVVGSGSTVANACFIEGGSVIGRECVVSHAAELDGLIFDGVFLYHYMEIYGIVGERSDIGAATVCGSLRFDDGRTRIRINGRWETPRRFSNATYIGDFCRTGVNATIMPGTRIGPYSVVGPGVVLDRDLAARTGIRVRQQTEEFPWGPERYGW